MKKNQQKGPCIQDRGKGLQVNLKIKNDAGGTVRAAFCPTRIAMFSKDSKTPQSAEIRGKRRTAQRVEKEQKIHKKGTEGKKGISRGGARLIKRRTPESLTLHSYS